MRKQKVEIEKITKNTLQATAGLWHVKETGVAYQKRMRKQWEKRNHAS